MPCNTPTPAERDPICACSLYPQNMMGGISELDTVIGAWAGVADLMLPVENGVDLHTVDREDLYSLLNLLATLARWHLARYYAEKSTGGKPC